MIKKFTCPLCGNHYINPPAVWAHMSKSHTSEIPEGFSSDRYYYDLTHDGKITVCTECKRPTTWNPRTHKYHRLCDRPECRESVRQTFRERMLRTRGTDNLAADPEHQRNMLKGRSISGTYTWSDGGTTDYTGTYEKAFLECCDLIEDLNSSDILGPSPNTYRYKYNGEYHFYIPDFYIPDIKLEIEIKDGGSNPNMHHKIQDVDKVKEKLKDRVMLRQHTNHYIKITDKNHDMFITLYNKLVTENMTEKEKRDKIKIILK